MGSHFVSLTDLNLDRFQHTRGFNDLFREPDWRQRADFLTRLSTLIERIPPLERDVIDLYFYRGKRQETISRLLGLSQQAVSHRMYSAFRRILFMMEQPEVPQARMRADLSAMIPNAFTVAVLCDFAQTSSQTVTARNLGVQQQRVCRHLNGAVARLRKRISLDSLFYVAYFERLMEHRSILHEGARPDGKADARLEAECVRYAHRLARLTRPPSRAGRTPSQNAAVA